MVQSAILTWGVRTRLVAVGDYQVDYTYDNAYELTRELRTGNTPYDISYTYDEVGNRLTKTVAGQGTESSTYGDNNQCLSAGSKTFGYDANGNLTTKTQAGQSTTYAWGYENELLSITYPGGGNNSFTTNRLTNRTWKSDSLGASTSLYDRQAVVADTRTDTTWGGGTGVLSERAGTASRWYHGDPTPTGRGEPASRTDAGENATDSLEYDAFGLAVNTVGNSVTPFRHKGGLGYRTDPDSGLLLLGVRYYDPSLGRFISRDPLGYGAGDVNLYRYAGNNPVNGSDPSGLWPGDPYDIEDEAAKAALREIYMRSVRRGREYGGWIYYDPRGRFWSYTKPVEGEPTRVAVPRTTIPPGMTAAGRYHTHVPRPGTFPERPSLTDQQNAIDSGLPTYIGTPTGRVIVYDPTELDPGKRQLEIYRGWWPAWMKGKRENRGGGY